MNLIFITVDGLRRDRIGKVPSLAAMAKESLFFSGIITAAPYTIASMHALLSGAYPSRNGVNAYYNMFKFNKNFKTLAEYMKSAGCFCRADVINDSVLPKAGFGVFEIHDENKDNLAERHCRILDEVKGEKSFFLYLHYSNIHTKLIRDVQKPYNDFSKEFFAAKEANEKRYDSYMKDCDGYLKAILAKIEASGMKESTVIVIVSDHGISFGEKEGERMYGTFVYDYTLKTFCIIKVPGVAPRETAWQASSVDILPTILELFKIPLDTKREKPDGSSLLSLSQDRLVFSETGGLGGPWPSHREHNVFCARLPEAKAIYCKTPDKWEFYDLKNDPNEERPKSAPANETQKTLMDAVKKRYGV